GSALSPGELSEGNLPKDFFRRLCSPKRMERMAILKAPFWAFRYHWPKRIRSCGAMGAPGSVGTRKQTLPVHASHRPAGFKPLVDFGELLFAGISIRGVGIARQSGQLPGAYHVASRIPQRASESEASFRQKGPIVRNLLGQRKRPLERFNCPSG